jgi:glycosyltransferase involved in cell wall biosynthesis
METNRPAPLFRRKKLVVTIHDLIHLRFPNYLPSATALLYAKTFLPAVCRKADAIIAVSDYTKSDLVQMLGINPKKITVIHHGIDPVFIGREEQPKTEEVYLLYVGLIKAHKNVGVLLDAFQKVKQSSEMESLKLELVGTVDHKQPMVRQWLERIKNDSSITLHSNISDNELKRLYRDAAALVFPSLYEGFGFPVLEAMASQTPVVASLATSIPEVAGADGALYFDPNSVSELTACLERILTSEELRNKLIRAGQKRLPLFDWDLAAQKTIQVYESVLGNN